MAPPGGSRWLPRLQPRDSYACAAVLACFALPYLLGVLHDARLAWELFFSTPAFLPALGTCLGLGAVAGWALRRQRPLVWIVAAAGTALLLAPLVMSKMLLGTAPSLPGLTVVPWLAAALLTLVCWRVAQAERGLWLILGAAGAFSLGISIRNYVLNTDHHDMVIFVQAFVSTLHHGMFFRSAVETGTHFGHHNSPILLLLLPVYALGKGYGLLVAQSLAVASSGWPLAQILYRKGLDRPAARLICGGYLFLPMIMGPTLRAFHELPLAVPLLLWACYFFEEQRAGPFYLFVVLSLLVRENVAFVIGMFAPYALGRRRGWAWVLPPALMAACWVWFSFFVVFPMSNPRGIMHVTAGTGHAWLGGTPREVAGHLLLRPGDVLGQVLLPKNRTYLSELLAYFGNLLPLGGLAAIFALPDVTINCLTRYDLPPVRHLDWHYHMLATSLLTVAFASTLLGLARRFQLSRAVLVFAALLFCTVSFRGAFDWVPPLLQITTTAEARAARATISARLPVDARVALPPGLLLALADPHWNAVQSEARRLAGEAPGWVVTSPNDTWTGDPLRPEDLPRLGYVPVSRVLSYQIWRRGAAAPRGRRSRPST